MVTTRRALFGAGALALLAGCGPEEEPKVDTEAVLSEQQRLTQRVVDSYEGVPLAGALKANAEARLRQIDAALEQKPGDTFEKEADTGLEAALAAEGEALRAHVAAVGQLEAREYRELLAGLINGAATNQSALLLRLDRPPAPTAFPGQPV